MSHNGATDQVGQCVHAERPTQFRFGDDRSLDVSWHWQEMIAQLGDESMRHAVEGADPNNRSRGVAGCMTVQTITYDRTRHFAKMHAEGGQRVEE